MKKTLKLIEFRVFTLNKSELEAKQVYSAHLHKRFKLRGDWRELTDK